MAPNPITPNQSRAQVPQGSGARDCSGRTGAAPYNPAHERANTGRPLGAPPLFMSAESADRNYYHGGASGLERQKKAKQKKPASTHKGQSKRLVLATYARSDQLPHIYYDSFVNQLNAEFDRLDRRVRCTGFKPHYTYGFEIELTDVPSPQELDLVRGFYFNFVPETQNGPRPEIHLPSTYSYVKMVGVPRYADRHCLRENTADNVRAAVETSPYAQYIHWKTTLHLCRTS